MKAARLTLAEMEMAVTRDPYTNKDGVGCRSKVLSPMRSFPVLWRNLRQRLKDSKMTPELEALWKALARAGRR